MRPVFVTGLGLISPLGNDIDTAFDAAVTARSAVHPLIGMGLPDLVGATAAFDPSPRFTRMQLTGLDRVSQFAVAAASLAVSDAGIDPATWDSERVGVYLGCGMGGAEAIDSGYRMIYAEGKKAPPLTVVAGMVNAPASHVSLRLGIRGPVMTYAMACTSAAAAIGEALKAIRCGEVDIAIAGGAEAPLTFGTVKAWEALRTLAAPDPADPARSCKPFSANRSGLVLGEGAAMLVLENAKHLGQRRARARLAGYGNASDATHITKPDMRGQVSAMRRALQDAGMTPAQVGYINAHGTATLTGDSVETRAIRAVWDDQANQLAVSSTKAVHGHLLGAAGALELVLTIRALERGVLPPTAHLEQADAECDLNFLADGARSVPTLRAAMSNSFGFGGSNVSLVVEKLD
ncbi:MAG: beta-ketoacyl-[acyl-carrier-protein] synthase family protein [Betaproteobacteria bacterium]|nr:beta-ketoacyl-[acyl-carrier-protein] synthase family protein [Betaproteobacteria bacterium]